ncbi:MAG: ABC transporter ATP-binding protein [Planctomycetes bacterium]|nr:ABC transporter ATP-binding protein [Planctomycetota bacterium]
MNDVPVHAAAAGSAAIRVRGLERRFLSGGQQLEILRGVDLDVAPGEAVAIVGRSGGGKSTLLHLIGLLDRPDGGSIELEGIDVGKASRRVRDTLRRDRLGFVFQFYHLLPELTAEQNVLLGAMIGVSPFQWMTSRKATRAAARELLERVGLADRANHLPNRLSGGERQRVAIARALLRQPALLLCDEPTGNLDERTSGEIEELLLAIRRERGAAMVLVTHNLRLAHRLDRVVRLEGGRLHAVQAPGTAEGAVPLTMA